LGQGMARAVPAPTLGEVKHTAALVALWASPSSTGWFTTELDTQGHADRVNSLIVLMFI